MDIRRERAAIQAFVVGLAVSLVMLAAACWAFVTRATDAVRLDQAIVTEVSHADGGTESFGSNSFSGARKGDTVTCRVPASSLPATSSAALVFHAYNAVVQVYVGESLVYAQDGSDMGLFHQPGQRVYEIALPDGFHDADLSVVLNLRGSGTITAVRDVFVTRAVDAYRAVLRGHEFELLVFAALFVLSCVGLFLSLMYALQQREPNEFLFISLFVVLVSLWELGSTRLLSVLSANVSFAANAEYVALFACPAPLAFYMALVLEGRLARTIARVLGGASLALFALATLLAVLPMNVTYNDLTVFFRVFFALSLVTYFVLLWRERESAGSGLRGLLLRYGLSASALLALLELIRSQLADALAGAAPLVSDLSLSTFAVICMVATLGLASVTHGAEEYNQEVERRELSRLAFTDPLTGIPNRSSVYRDIEDELRDGHPQPYTMVLMDLNGLKEANDGYGHEMGDRLMQVVAMAVRNAFDQVGFYGRWGGDEFVACVVGGTTVAKAAVARFKKNINRINAAERFPFLVSVSIGRVDSTPQDPLDPYDAIMQADSQMMRDKRNHRRANAANKKELAERRQRKQAAQRPAGAARPAPAPAAPDPAARGLPQSSPTPVSQMRRRRS